ncbi:MAG: M56 family metallopeptidase [Maricaulaceae bacterium]
MSVNTLNERAEMLAVWAGQTGLAIAVLVIFILIIRRPVAKYFGAKAAYALWALPLLRLFMPTISLPSWMSFQSPSAPSNIAVIYPPNLESAYAPTLMVDPALSWMSYAVLLWVIVACGLIARGLYRHHSYRQIIMKTAVEVTPDVKIMADDIAKAIGLKRRAIIRVSDKNVGPLVMGVMSPCIILPKNFTEHFTSQQQQLALLHEMLHIKRGDLWAAFAAFIFGALNWPNPFMRIAARAFRHDQEAACDMSVLNHPISKGADRASYAQTLMQAATLRSSTPAEMPLGLSIHHPLKERIMSLKNPTPTARLRPRLIGASAMAAAVMLTVPYSLADPAEELAGKSVKTHSIMKIVTNDNGEKTKKTIEITRNGDTIEAWETNELTGERRELEASELGNMDIQIKDFNGNMKHNSDMDVHVMTMSDDVTFHKDAIAEIIKLKDNHDADGMHIRKRIIINGDHGQIVMPEDLQKHVSSEKNVFVVKMNKDGQYHSRIATEAKIAAALSLLGDEMEGEEISEDVRRSLRKAHKALEKAQRKLDAEK